MQTLADVLNCPIKVIKSEQACALGTAMFAAVAAGIYHQIDEAQNAMGKGFLCEYIPNPANSQLYEELYRKYLKTGKFSETMA